ncbi:MAG: hypothetical protein WCT85_01840 [Parachlamydiales bacterium]|jgi:hypothetical protein
MKINIFGNKKVAEGVVEEKKVNEAPVAKKEVTQVAQASLARIPQSESKVTKVINYSKENLPRIAYTVALSAAVILLGCGIGLSSTALLATGATLAGAGILGASAYEYKKAHLIDAHAKELYEAAKELNKSVANGERLTANERFANAKKQIEEDLVSLAPANRDAFVKRLVSAAKNDPDLRISLDDRRFGIEGHPGVSYNAFVLSIVNAKLAEIAKAYDKELKAIAEPFVREIKEDIQNSKKIQSEMNKKAYELASKAEYKILAKERNVVLSDLQAEIKNQLGEGYVRREIKNLTALMTTNTYAFWPQVEAFRSIARKDFDKKFKEQNQNLKDLEAQIKALEDSEKALEKQKVNLREIVRDLNNAGDKIEEAYRKIADIDAKKAEINENKNAINKQISDLRTELAHIELKIAADYLADLNARRAVLAKLVGEEVTNINDLPAYPTVSDKAKYWAPRVAGVAGGVVAAASYYFGLSNLMGSSN